MVAASLARHGDRFRTRLLDFPRDRGGTREHPQSACSALRPGGPLHACAQCPTRHSRDDRDPSAAGRRAGRCRLSAAFSMSATDADIEISADWRADARSTAHLLDRHLFGVRELTLRRFGWTALFVAGFTLWSTM